MSVARMLKATIIGHKNDENATLDLLQELGLLHVSPFSIKNKDNQEDGDREKVTKRNQKLLKVRHIINYAPDLHVQKKTITSSVFEKSLDDIMIADENIKKHQDELKHINNYILTLSPWGNFDYNDVEFLRKAGVEIEFAILSTSDWNLLDKQKKAYYIANSSDDQVWVVFVGAKSELKNVTTVKLPKLELKKLKNREIELREDISQERKKISELSGVETLVAAELRSIENQVLRLKAKSCMMKSDGLFGITGFIPEIKKEEVKEIAIKQRVAIRLAPPEEAELVPVQLENNRLFSGYEYILKAFTGLSYREKDVTWAVGILFMIFGSLCLIDAGYGIFLYITGLVLDKKNIKGISSVFMTTGIFSLIIGLLSGQIFGFIFGVDILKDTTPILSLAKNPLDCFVFSLLTGLVAMVFGYGVAINQKGIKSSATGGFLLSFGSLIAVFSYLTKIEPIISLGKIAGCTFLIATFVSWILFPERVFENSKAPNIIWTLYAGTTGLVQDVLSHMRLFGIALSGAILALVVNKIGSMFPMIVTVPFLIIGHIFVFLLALLSLYIHTNRLIFLEFGGKCLTGGHYFYSPFRRSS